jgi:hypothetical protein
VSFADCSRSNQPVDLIGRKGLGSKSSPNPIAHCFVPLVVGFVVTTLFGIIYSRSRAGAADVGLMIASPTGRLRTIDPSKVADAASAVLACTAAVGTAGHHMRTVGGDAVPGSAKPRKLSIAECASNIVEAPVAVVCDQNERCCVASRP